MAFSVLLSVALSLVLPRPTLQFKDPQLQQRLGVPFTEGLQNLLDVNAVSFDPKVYNRTGLMKGSKFIRAGGGYDQPWTRDAAINSWNAASLIAPELARDTLWAATVPRGNGEVIVQPDNQWWDKVIWVIGAWNHYQVTGDREFLETSFGVATRLLHDMRATHFNSKFGLFEGPSFFNDGIAGYPSPPANSDDGGSSFVLDHAGADRIMALSTNCLYVGAYRAAGQMAQALGARNQEWTQAANILKKDINRRFWMSGPGTYGYLLSPEGRLDPSQEGCGLAFATLFDVASPSRARSMIRRAHMEPFGIVDVYPPFPRFSDDRPGRHNAIVWPMVQGMWARAAAHLHDADTLRAQIETLARLVAESKGHYFEIYNAKTGEPDGGWQNGRHWESAPEQTWSATAYVSMIANGLFGMRFSKDGLRFEPTVPIGWGTVSLSDVRYRGAVLDVRLEGAGTRVGKLLLDGKPVGHIPATLRGAHSVSIVVR